MKLSTAALFCSLLSLVLCGVNYWLVNRPGGIDNPLPVPVADDFDDYTPEALTKVEAEVAKLEAPTHDVGQQSRKDYPQMGYCCRCGVTWNVIEGTKPEILSAVGPSERELVHMIKFRYDEKGEQQSAGCFPCCEACWQASTLEERLKYARHLVEVWKIDQKYQPASWEKKDYEAEWVLIEKEIRREWDAAQKAKI